VSRERADRSRRDRAGYRAIVEYYDAEYAHLEMLQLDVPFMLQTFPKRPCDALEIAVGSGRAAIPVAQAGHRVVGIDHDPRIVQLARRKRDAVGLGERELSLQVADARSFSLGRTFDRVFLLFNTLLNFTTLEDLDAVLQRVREHLAPRGRFYLDVFNPDLSLLARGKQTCLEGLMFHVPELDRTVHRELDLDVDATRQVQKMVFRYRWFDRLGVEHTQRIRFELTFLFPRELQVLLERNGLRIERWWGDYDGSDLGDESPRILADCRLA
jgi:SAM-dependent methyltransferase